MALDPRTWNALIEDERTQVVIRPFLGFFDLGDLEPDDTALPAAFERRFIPLPSAQDKAS